MELRQEQLKEELKSQVAFRKCGGRAGEEDVGGGRLGLQGGLCGKCGPGIGPCQISVLSPGRTGEVFIIFFPGGEGWRQAGAWRADGAVG